MCWPRFRGSIRVKIQVLGFSRVLNPENAAGAHVLSALGALSARSHRPLCMGSAWRDAFLYERWLKFSFLGFNFMQILNLPHIHLLL